MLTAVVLAATEAAEPSKTAFYICGGLLAAFAVLVALYGVSRPSFPGNRHAERAVMVLAAVLVVAAMATAVATA